MKTQVLITAIICTMLSFTSLAQNKENRFSFEISGGPSYSFKDLAGSDLNIGGGFELLFHYDFMPHTGLYAGWGWNHFTAEKSFMGENTGFEETGYILGVQHKRPFPNSTVQYFIRAGGLWNHLEVENETGELVGDTGHGLGWQVSSGIYIPLGKGWHFTPGLKFNSLSRTLEYDQQKTNLDLNYMSLRIGFVKDF